MSDRVTYDSTMRVLPSVLKKSGLTLHLGQATAKFLELADCDVRLASIYARIDELPEDLLDILAIDFDVLWYEFNYDLETKRRLIKESFYVHRHLGTIGATKQALCAVWPHTDIEEWFEYDGDPYYFRVLIEANSTQPIHVEKILDTIRQYQSIRSHLEDGMPIIRVTFGIVIKTQPFNSLYHVDPVGTQKSAKNAKGKSYYIPNYSTHGDKSYERLIVETDGKSVPYSVPATGELIAGTYPRVQSHGERDEGGLYVGAETLESTYRARPCGTSLNSLM